MPDTSSPPKAGPGIPRPDALVPGRLAEIVGALLWLLGLVTIGTMPPWGNVCFYLIWISFALLYGLRAWPRRPALWLIAAVAASTAAAGGLDVVRGLMPVASLAKVPLMAVMFCVIVWQTHRRLAADTARSAVSAQNERLLDAQRRFLQDASHQLKTPITIALGHSELLARELVSRDSKRDIDVVVGELNRLKSLSERLLLIASSENPDFLAPEPVDLRLFVMDRLLRWRPTALRQWRIGQLDEAVVAADPERLALAIDALLENAVQHTDADDAIRLSVVCGEHARFACVVIEDSGEGIPQPELAHIFDRFRTASVRGGRRGTGLGLALAQAVARGHGGVVGVRSELGQGSRFQFALPVLAMANEGGSAAAESAGVGVAPGAAPAASAAARPTAAGPRRPGSPT